MQRRSGLCVVSIDKGDDRGSRLPVAQCFQNGKALQIGADIDNGEINIVHCEVEDLEAVFSRPGVGFALCT